MLHIRKRNQRRPAAFLLMLLVLLSCLAPCAAAEDTESVTAEAGASFSAEPACIVTDDALSCTSGYLIYCSNPDKLPLRLFADIRSTVRDGETLSTGVSVLSDEARSWIAVRTVSIDAEEGAEDAAMDRQPAFIVEFRDPGDGSECPEFLKPVSSDGASLYVLSPAYTAVFQAGAPAAEGGDYAAITEPLVCCPENDTFLFSLERPQRFAVRLTQELEPVVPSQDAEQPEDAEASAEAPEETEESAEGQLMSSAYRVCADSALSVYCYLPKNVRTVLDRLSQNPASYDGYGITPGTLYLQFDVTANDGEDLYSAETESVLSLWEGGMLLPVAAPDGVICTESFDFSAEAFRSMLDENVFITSPQKTEEPAPAEDAENAEIPEETPADAAAAEEPVPVFYAVDPDNTMLHVRARFVLPVTAADGSVRYAVSAFTDPFSCGAQNTLVTDPTSMDAPLLENGEMELLDDGSAVLNYDIIPGDTQRETAVWLAYKEAGTLSCEMNLSVNGSEWIAADYDTDTPETGLLSGCRCSIRIPAEDMTEYAYIRIRSRYAAVTENGRLESPWSESYAFENKPEEILTAPVETVTVPLYESETEEPGEQKFVCPLCGICPAPYGVCLFLWIGAALLIVLFVVLIIAILPHKKTCPRCNKKCRKDEKVCPECGYRFVGTMPAVEDDEEDEESEEEAPRAEEAARAEEPAHPVSREPRPSQAQSDAVKPSESKPPVKPLPFTATPEFLSALKAKMQEAKAGGHPRFTQEEIAYIKMLREKRQQSAPAETPSAEEAQRRSAQEQFSAIFRKALDSDDAPAENKAADSEGAPRTSRDSGSDSDKQ